MNQGRRYWIKEGKISLSDDQLKDHSALEERKVFEQGLVRITTGDLGTEIKWHVFSPCVASMFAAIPWLEQAKPPYVLRFHVSGWFEEFYQTHAEVTKRIEDIIARGDRHFTTRTLIKEFDWHEKPLTPLLESCLIDESQAGQYAVECVYEEHTQQFLVETIGEKSAIRKVWGNFLSSYPCQTSNQYGQVVSEAYQQVLNTGKPRFDHVLAALRMPNNEVFWVPYKRLVLPKRGSTHRPTVLVVSEITGVDIQLI